MKYLITLAIAALLGLLIYLGRQVRHGGPDESTAAALWLLLTFVGCAIAVVVGILYRIIT
ncbi:hypothetical protein [Roseiconus lacunae]|uniref:hypothetical protein n=1 Tax=Roseiconus lacunae TaxID=2605694 RepID=UPI001E4D911A|nr:hypothetical protein [Roseiconus lacunae]MCD0459117.1 hypothetical protein [Roseiconus lacunae]